MRFAFGAGFAARRVAGALRRSGVAADNRGRETASEASAT
jgi:hypothetical protein